MDLWETPSFLLNHIVKRSMLPCCPLGCNSKGSASLVINRNAYTQQDLWGKEVKAEFSTNYKINESCCFYT